MDPTTTQMTMDLRTTTVVPARLPIPALAAMLHLPRPLLLPPSKTLSVNNHFFLPPKSSRRCWCHDICEMVATW